MASTTTRPPPPHPVDLTSLPSPSALGRRALPQSPSITDLEHAAWASDRDVFQVASVAECHTGLTLSIVVFGASGDLAKKKTYPALFALFAKDFLPTHLQIMGYARSDMTDQQLRDRIRPGLPKDQPKKVEQFLARCFYMAGHYDGESGYQELHNRLQQFENRAVKAAQDSKCGDAPVVGRLMYLALPPVTYPEVCTGLRNHCFDLGSSVSPGSWFRVVMEKPFGFDLATSEELANTIGALLSEGHIYRIDHYLGKELVQNLVVLRFANNMFSSWWNRQYVSNVQVSFKEDFGTQGRGGYFDQYGIVRDVIQNHLMQVLALLTMECPISLHPDDVRDEKVKVIRSMPPVSIDDCVIGQYVAGNGQPGYLEDPTVPKGSKQATYAAVKLHINNERWAGVPFIIKAGKALNERVAVVRMQLKTPPASIFGNLDAMRNELVIKFQPGEAIYTKLVVKRPGLDVDKDVSELELTYPERYKDVVIPDAYERLILDCIRGDQQHFVRRDELRAAWAVFTPLLHAIDRGEVPLHEYKYGSRGPAAADDLTRAAGYIRTHYEWRKDSGEQLARSNTMRDAAAIGMAAAAAGVSPAAAAVAGAAAALSASKI